MSDDVLPSRLPEFSLAWLVALGLVALLPLLGGIEVAWSVLTLGVMLLGLLVASVFVQGRDLFAPAVLFPLGYAGYFGFGFLPLLVGNVPGWLWMYEALGLVAYLAGAGAVGLLVRRHLLRWPRGLPPAPLRWNPVPWRLNAAVAASLLAALAAAGLIVRQTGGLPIFHVDARHTLSAYLFVTVEFGWVAAIWWNFDRWQRRGCVSRSGLAVLGGAALLLFVLAYRTPLMLLALVAAQGHARIVRPMRLRVIAGLMALLLVFAGAFGWWRLQHTARYGGWQGYLAKTHAKWTALEPLAPLLMTIREGSIVFGDLVEQIPSRYPFQQGRVMFSAVTTLLPGWQRGPREWIGIYARGTEHSTTPSILGFLYVDWGIPGIAIGMFLFGAGIAWLYHLATARPSPLTLWLWAYFNAVLLFGIHTGIADLSHLVLTLFALGLAWGVHPRPWRWLQRGSAAA